MKFILKESEPIAWKNFRNTEGVEFRAIKELKNALLNEQGHLCCYCMSRIYFESMKAEHWSPRSNIQLVFDYNNLLAACTGNFCTGNHCDTLKADIVISIKPTDKLNNVENIISYSFSDGSLKYPPQYKSDIEEALNLNNPVLKRNRLEVVKTVHQILLSRKYSKSECQKQLEKFKNRNKEGHFSPYCTVAIKFLEKKLRQYK